jgi:hypothetical protein
MLRITSFKARASGRTANVGRERSLTAARVGAGCARRRGILRGPRKPERAPAALPRGFGHVGDPGGYPLPLIPCRRRQWPRPPSSRSVPTSKKSDETLGADDPWRNRGGASCARRAGRSGRRRRFRAGRPPPIAFVSTPSAKRPSRRARTSRCSCLLPARSGTSTSTARSEAEHNAIVDASAAEIWWGKLLVFLKRQQAASVLRQWPGRSDARAHGPEAVRAQLVAERAASELGPGFRRLLDDSRLISALKKIGSDPRLRLMLDGKRLISVRERG